MFVSQMIPKVVTSIEMMDQIYAGKILENLMPLAMEGDISAMMTCAYRYDQGVGTLQDINNAAIEWYLNAAQCREAEAFYHSPLIYANSESPLYNLRVARYGYVEPNDWGIHRQALSRVSCNSDR